MWTTVFLISCWRSGRVSVIFAVGLAPACVVDRSAATVGANGSWAGHGAPLPS
jgi:hypothetical protein